MVNLGTKAGPTSVVVTASRGANASSLGSPKVWEGRRFTKGVLLALVLAGGASLLTGDGDRDADDAGPIERPVPSVQELLRTFAGSREYLTSAGWGARDGTFVPLEAARERKSLRSAIPRPRLPTAGLGRRQEMRLASFKRTIVRSDKRNACGRGRVRDVHHLSAVLPGVSPAFVMDVLVNPSHGVKWNPSVRKVVLRHQRRVKAVEPLPDAFTEEVVKSSSSAKSLDSSRSDVYDVVAQVSEIPLPSFVKRATGPRHTADFIAARYDAQAGRGFTLATSHGAEAVASAAGVRKGQELCLSAIMVAPSSAEGEDGSILDGTQVHLVTHFDAQLPSKQLRKVVNVAVGKSLHQMLGALHRKALAAQDSGRHPYTR